MNKAAIWKFSGGETIGWTDSRGASITLDSGTMTPTQLPPAPTIATPPTLAMLMQSFSPVHRSVFRAPSLDRVLAPIEVSAMVAELSAPRAQRLSAN